MALEHALLVSLSERSGSGYELAQRFDRSIGFFWSATHQQIYRVLKRMEHAGWLECEVVAQEGKPDKKVYEVNAAGRAELARWIGEQGAAEFPRSELAVKIRAARFGDIDDLLAEVTRHRDRHAARLEVLRLIEKRDFPAPEHLAEGDLHQYLVLRGGIRVESGFVEWCEEVLDTLGDTAGTAPRPERETPPETERGIG